MQYECALLWCVLPLSTIFFPHFLIKGKIFKKKVTKHKMCPLIVPTNFIRNISHSTKRWTRYYKKIYSGLHVQYPLSCPIFRKFEFTRQIFENSSNMKFYKNSSSGSRVVPCGRTDRRTDTTKLIVIFRNFTNAPKQCKIFRIFCVAADIQI